MNPDQPDDPSQRNGAWVGYRCRGRPNAETKVKILDTAELLAMLECAEVPTLLTKLDSIGVKPHVALGPGGSKQVFASDHQLPSELR